MGHSEEVGVFRRKKNYRHHRSALMGRAVAGRDGCASRPAFALLFQGGRDAAIGIFCKKNIERVVRTSRGRLLTSPA